MPFSKFALGRPRLEKSRGGFPSAHFFQNVVELRNLNDSKRLVNRLAGRIRGVRSGVSGNVERLPVVRE